MLGSLQLSPNVLAFRKNQTKHMRMLILHPFGSRYQRFSGRSMSPAVNIFRVQPLNPPSHHENLR